MAAAEAYKIPIENWGKLQEDIERLNKKADKLGCERIRLTVVRTVDLPEDDDLHSGHGAGNSRYHRFYEVTVEGKAPSLNGWRLAAVLQHLTDDQGQAQTLVRSVPGEVIPETYQAAPNWCDHCKADRYRTDTFVVIGENGVTKQVGRQCLRDFLGHSDPSRIASWAETLAGVRDLMEEYTHPSGDRRTRLAGLEFYLTFVVKAIREYGWLSRSTLRKASGEDTRKRIATADRAQWAMHSYTKKKTPTKPPGNMRPG